MARQKPMYTQTSKLGEEPKKALASKIIWSDRPLHVITCGCGLPSLCSQFLSMALSQMQQALKIRRSTLVIFYSFSFEFIQIQCTNVQQNMSTLSKQQFLQTCKLRAHSLPFAIWQLWSSWILVVELFVSAQEERKPLVLNSPGLQCL